MDFPSLAEHFRAGGLIELGLDPALQDGIQNPHRAGSGDIGGVFGHIETHPNVALCTQVINLVRLDGLQEPVEPGRVAQVPKVKEHTGIVAMGVLIEMVNAAGIEGTGPTDEPMDLIAFFQQELGQIGSVLSRDPRDERFLSGNHIPPLRFVKTQSQPFSCV